MNEKQALLHMAELWDKPRVDVNKRAYVVTESIRRCGICGTLNFLYDTGKISTDVYLSIYRKIGPIVDQHGRPTGYLSPRTIEGAKRRAALCRELAEQCEEKKS